MSEVGQITVKIGADTYELQKGLTDAKTKVSEFDRSTAGLSSSLKSLGLVAVATATAVAAFVKSQIDAMDNLGKLSQKIGVTTNDLSKLAYSARLSDVDIGSLQQSFVILARGLSEASQGSGNALTAFNALGISIRNTDGTLKTSQQIMLEVADLFAMMEDGAQKTALSVAIFGRAGANLIPLLNQGSKAIREQGDELERLGGVVTAQAAKEAEEFNDNLTRLNMSLGALGKSIAMEVMPYLTQLSDEFLIARKNGIGFFDMLQMGTRFGEYKTQLEKVREEIKRLADTPDFAAPRKEERLESLKRQEATLLAVIQRTEELNAKQNMMGPPTSAMGKIAAPEMVDAKAQETALKQQQDLMAAQATRLETILQGNMSEIELEKQKYAELLNQLQISKEMFAVEEETYQQWELDSFNAHQQKLTELTRQEANKRIAEQQRESQMVNAARMQTASLAVGLLQTLGQKSKAAALAAIVLNKGLMIAQTIMNTQAASMRAMAELGPIAGPPAAAAIQAMGAASVGIIGATGLLEAGAAMSGGGGGGFSGSSTGATSVANTVRNAENNAQGASGGGQTVNIALQGNTFNRDQVRDLITQINEVISDGSTLRLA